MLQWGLEFRWHQDQTCIVSPVLNHGNSRSNSLSLVAVVQPDLPAHHAPKPWQWILDTSMRQVDAGTKVPLSLVSMTCEGKCCTNTRCSQWNNWDGLIHIHERSRQEEIQFLSDIPLYAINKRDGNKACHAPKEPRKEHESKGKWRQKARAESRAKTIAKGWQMPRTKASVIPCTVTISNKGMSYSTTKLCIRLHDFDPRVDSPEHSVTTCHNPDHYKHSEVSSPPLDSIATTSHVLWTVAGGTNGHTLIPWTSDRSHFSNLHKQFGTWHPVRDMMHVVWCDECVVGCDLKKHTCEAPSKQSSGFSSFALNGWLQTSQILRMQTCGYICSSAWDMKFWKNLMYNLFAELSLKLCLANIVMQDSAWSRFRHASAQPVEPCTENSDDMFMCVIWVRKSNKKQNQWYSGPSTACCLRHSAKICSIVVRSLT